MRNRGKAVGLVIGMALSSVVSANDSASEQAHAKFSPAELQQAQEIFNKINLEAQPYLVSVSECYMDHEHLDSCNAGQDGIPKEITSSTQNISGLTVTQGIITITPKAQAVITEHDKLIITPSINSENQITWVFSGPAVEAELFKK